MRTLHFVARRAVPTALLFLTSAAVHAQTVPFLDMTVSPSALTVAPGAAPFWDIQLTNNNAENAFLVIVGFNDGLGSTPDVSVPAYDPTPFGVTRILTPGTTLTLSSLFQTVVSPTAAPAVYDNLAELTYDLYTDDTYTTILSGGTIASGDWQVTVSGGAAAPEPATLALVATGALLVGVVRRRRG